MADLEPLEITVCKADRTVESTRSVVLRISADLPEFPVPESEWRPFYRERFRSEAERVMRALESLPGGTIDQLLLILLERRASVLRVPGWAKEAENG